MEQYKSPLTLQELAVKKLSSFVDKHLEVCYKNGNTQLAEDMCDYIQTAYHLLDVILDYIPNTNTADYVALYPFLRTLTIERMSTFNKIGTSGYSFPKVTRLNLLVYLSSTEKPSRDLLLNSVVKSVKNLVSITIHCFFGEELLKTIGSCCENLKVFHCSYSMYDVISNQGLMSLSRCQKLTHVMFVDSLGDIVCSPGERIQSEVTIDGLAEFIISLPDLKVCTYKRSKLSKALEYIHEHHKEKQLKLEYLSLKNCRSKFIALYLSSLCPNLIELSIQNTSWENFHYLSLYLALTNLPHFKSLLLKNCVIHDLGTDVIMAGVLNHLTSLTIISPCAPDMLDRNFYESVGTHCVGLRELNIKFSSLGDEAFVEEECSKKLNIFPSLEILRLERIHDASLLQFLLKSTCSLKILCVVSSYKILDIGGVFVAAVQCGSLTNLNSLHMLFCSVTVNDLMALMDECYNLRSIWGLRSTDTIGVDDKFIKTYVTSKNLNISLHLNHMYEECIKCSFSLGYKKFIEETHQMPLLM